MTYATLQDLTDVCGARELIQLSDRGDMPVDWIDEAVVTRALSDADELINGYLGGVYALPLTNAPRMLIGAACDIARYKLWKDRASDEVVRRFKEALALLTQIQGGRVKLPDQAGVEPAAKTGVILTSMPERQFTRDTMRRF
ncbi:gp436 family protein [Caulobacter soli]|uniref:gp436 family protein n=1 Tax=Caulobacter soli TaxID=2708539 RepID=UPI0013EB2BA4|nr:DUF1320 domain-containing protein [Caulobacter soli]